MEIRWQSLMIDVPARRFGAALEYWPAITGTTLGDPLGDEEEYVPLAPPTGDRYLFLQRIGSDTPGCHLDLHVDDLDVAASAAEGLGARLVTTVEGLRVLNTPAGMPFCFVDEEPGRIRHRPEPSAFADGRSVADQFSLDIPAAEFDREADFWAELTGWPRLRRPEEAGTEFDRLGVPEHVPAQILLQRVDDAPHAHLDFSADDREAEVERHCAFGAEVVRKTEGWTTLRDPAGVVYCVTGRATGVRIG